MNKTKTRVSFQLYRRGGRICLLALLVAALVLLMTGCNGKSSDAGYNMYSEAYDNYDYYGYDSTTTAYETVSANSSVTSEFEGVTDEQSAQTSGRKLIRNVSMTVETLHFDESCSGINLAVTQSGGYVESSSVSNNTYYSSYYSGYAGSRTASYTLRIPSDMLDSFLNAIGDVGNVTYRSETTEDVTLSYLDVEARAKSLELQQERLLALLAEAQTVEEIIALQDRISEVTYELEAKESILRNYDNLVSYSTVRISLEEVQRITEPEPETLGERITAGLSDTFYTIAESAKDFVVWLVVNLPLILIWLLIIAVFVLVIVKLVKLPAKRRARKAAERAKAAQTTAEAGTVPGYGDMSGNQEESK